MPTPLVLTGGPAVGKSTTGRLLARRCTRAAFIDVDDIRQLVIAGHAAPWEGAEGLAQQELGVLNTCDLAERFHQHGFQVVIADVLTPRTEQLYRRHLPGCVIVRLHTSPEEVRRRAGTRTVYLTDEELEAPACPGPAAAAGRRPPRGREISRHHASDGGGPTALGAGTVSMPGDRVGRLF